MKQIKKIIICLAFLAFLIVPITASAQSPLTNLTAATPDQLSNKGDLVQQIGIFTNVILGLLGVIFMILIIYGGFMWAIAGGDSGKVDKAKNIIKAAVIGLIIVMASYTITYFILGGLGIAGESQ